MAITTLMNPIAADICCIKRPLIDATDDGHTTKKARISCCGFQANNNNNNNNKKVRFAIVDDDSCPPHVQVHLIPLVEDADVAAVWYSAQELNATRCCDAQWIRCCNTYCHDYQKQLCRVLGTACGKEETCDAATTLALADSPMRGLERDMTPCFRQRKKQIVTNVLESQAALGAWKQAQEKISDEEAYNKGAEVLSCHYQKLALPSLKFALLLAEGDAQVVANME